MKDVPVLLRSGQRVLTKKNKTDLETAGADLDSQWKKTSHFRGTNGAKRKG